MCFYYKKFTKEIKIDDLSDLKINKISKEYLTDLFNKTIKSQIKTNPGEYIKAPALECKTQTSSDQDNPGEWQVMYIIDYGYISNIEIEFIPKNDTNVKSTSNLFNQYSQEFNEIDKLEKEIINKQSTSSDSLTESSSILKANSDLNNLLNEIYNDVLTK